MFDTPHGVGGGGDPASVVASLDMLCCGHEACLAGDDASIQERVLAITWRAGSRGWRSQWWHHDAVQSLQGAANLAVGPASVRSVLEALNAGVAIRACESEARQMLLRIGRRSPAALRAGVFHAKCRSPGPMTLLAHPGPRSDEHPQQPASQQSRVT